MLVVTDRGEGEFGHVGLADDHRPCLPQPADDDGIAQGGCGGPEHQRAGRGRLAGDIEQILDRDNGAVEWSERHAGSFARIAGVSRGPRGLGIELREHPFFAGTTGEAREDGFKMIAD